MLSDRFQQAIISKFAGSIEERFKDAKNIQFYSDAMLVQDITDYNIGPQFRFTPVKVVTLLFYLPQTLHKPIWNFRSMSRMIRTSGARADRTIRSTCSPEWYDADALHAELAFHVCEGRKLIPRS